MHVCVIKWIGELTQRRVDLLDKVEVTFVLLPQLSS